VIFDEPLDAAPAVIVGWVRPRRFRRFCTGSMTMKTVIRVPAGSTSVSM